VPPEEVGSLTEPFRRLETSRARSTGGYGLGLAVVRAVAAAHGGRVDLTARPEGGLEATVTLPAASARAPVSDAVGAGAA
jgi:signal transduction histidine kinase